MIDEGIFDGDTVIVKTTYRRKWRNGSRFDNGNEVTFKKL